MCVRARVNGVGMDSMTIFQIIGQALYIMQLIALERFTGSCFPSFCFFVLATLNFMQQTPISDT